MKSYKPIPMTWGRPLTKQEHYECYMLRQAGCDCDIPDIGYVGIDWSKCGDKIKCCRCATETILERK